MTDLWIKILSVLTIIMIISVMSYMTIMLKRHKSEGLIELAYCAFRGEWNVIYKNLHYIATHMVRMSLAGIVLLQISLLNNGLLKIKPDIQFVLALFFYIAFSLYVITNYKKEERLRLKIKQLESKIG